MRFNPKLSLTVLVVLGVLAIVYNVTIKEDLTIQNAKQWVHPTGLVVQVPQEYTAKKEEAGFVIEPENNANNAFRNPISIHVAVVENQVKDPRFETRNIGEKTIGYRIEKSEGGSGGDNYDLTAQEFVDEGCLVYTQTTQEETGEPDFELFWKIVANTSLKKP